MSGGSQPPPRPPGEHPWGDSAQLMLSSSRLACQPQHPLRRERPAQRTSQPQRVEQLVGKHCGCVGCATATQTSILTKVTAPTHPLPPSPAAPSSTLTPTPPSILLCLCVPVCLCSFGQLMFSGAAKMFSSTIRVRPTVDPDTLEPAGILNPLLASAQVGGAQRSAGGSGRWPCRCLHTAVLVGAALQRRGQRP
jgi:hypothetical protein